MPGKDSWQSWLGFHCEVVEKYFYKEKSFKSQVFLNFATH